MNRKDIAINFLCLGIREGGTYEYLEAMRGDAVPARSGALRAEPVALSRAKPPATIAVKRA